jgi:ABC-type branched-subunit amino acid transport system substrate-binding protein
MRSRRLALSITAALSLLVATAGCSDPQEPVIEPSAHAVNFYGTDGNMSNTLGEGLPPGLLNGVKGTAPLSELSDDFKRRLAGVDATLTQYNYAGEAFDAAMIAALAAELAHSNDARQIAKFVGAVTTSGTECRTAAICLDLIKSGHDIEYRGVTMSLSGLTDTGEPSTASYGLQAFGADNRIDDARTEYVRAGDPNAENDVKVATPDDHNARLDPLKMATLLPHSGALKDMGPAMRAGAELAVKELNAGGGIFGKAIKLSDADDGTNAKKASAEFDKLAAAGVSIIIGPTSSSASVALIPKAVQADVLLFSPSATADELTTINDGGLFFRTAPPDVMQASAVANMIMRDGSQRVYIIARDDSWGIGLENAVLQDLVRSGVLAKNIKIEKYDPDATSFADEAQEAKDFDPDAVLIIGFAESTQIIKEFAEMGVAQRSAS